MADSVKRRHCEIIATLYAHKTLHLIVLHGLCYTTLCVTHYSTTRPLCPHRALAVCACTGALADAIIIHNTSSIYRGKCICGVYSSYVYTYIWTVLVFKHDGQRSTVLQLIQYTYMHIYFVMLLRARSIT